MAALLVKTCLKRSFPGKKIIGVICNDQNKQYKFITIVSVTIFQCHYYHGTSALLKKKQGQEKGKRNIIHIVAEKKQVKKLVEVWQGMTVTDLANVTSRNLDDVIDVLFFSNKSIVYKPNSIIDNNSILIDAVRKLGYAPKIVANPETKEKKEDKDYDAVKRPPPDPSVLIKRRPVVTVMGHVDHGKTTLLDKLRNTSVVDSEFGGITQHIGAFNVTLNSGEKITFLDTPGHAAFSSMRSRGAHVTDIVILVVAADDGVMEQTVQSIEMAKDAKVPIIVAINKIDKSEANIERTQNMLAQHGIYLEALGGDVQSVNISALKNTNLDQLMEAVMAQAEIMDFKGDPTGSVEGVVIESTTDLGRGKLATALIQRGTLKNGDIIVSGLSWAKVRSMFDHAGNILKEGGLSDAVQIIGWRELPHAGDEILEVESEKRAQMVLRYRNAQLLEHKAIEQSKAAQEKFEKHLVEYKERLYKKRVLGIHRFTHVRKKETEPDDGVPKINVIIKADVAGSVEAILDTLGTYDNENKCRLNIVHYGVGPITETDAELSEIFNAIIYCFNIKGSRNINKSLNITIRHYNVIYKLIDDLKEEITKKLPRVTVENIIGEADMLQEFEINEKRKKIKVAGCRCTKGELKKVANYRIMRNNEVIYTGKLVSMKHLKQEVTSIKSGTECGLRMEDSEISFKPGDTIVCFTIHQELAKLHWNPGF